MPLVETVAGENVEEELWTFTVNAGPRVAAAIGGGFDSLA
jgi:hypothetical protein